MKDIPHILPELNKKFQENYKSKKIILSFPEYLRLVQQNPHNYIRNAVNYLLDVFDYYGKKDENYFGLVAEPRFNLFDNNNGKTRKIIGGELVQKEIYNNLIKLSRSQSVSKLILLHGPNGSAKTSTVDCIAHAMEKYSYTDDGAIYRFNWIFPVDKSSVPLGGGERSSIGFDATEQDREIPSFAFLDERKVAAKLISEFKENPLFLLPTEYRETFLRKCFSDLGEKDFQLPSHILASGLSKKNQEIFEALLNGYDGDLDKTLRHIQVERFFYSKQYRVGISTVEPQMSVDALERQVTLDKNYSHLPAILQTISFHQYSGELVEANRGLLEFSDLLKRPVESFKYLLSAVEKNAINLPSGVAQLDLVFLGTTNEKHLDGFKTIPEFSSFKARFELITVPYLLFAEKEEEIYEDDVKVIKNFKPVAPHCIQLLSQWAIMTRLKKPDLEQYDPKYQPIIAKLDPRTKSLLYEKKSLMPFFTKEEQALLYEIREKIWRESQGSVVYEGRFGASSRELKAILHRAAQSTEYEEILPMNIFDELKELTKNRTVYEFLQFEPRGFFHDVPWFLKVIKENFLKIFEREILQSMAITDAQEYSTYLRRYIDHVVSEIKKEKLFDEASNSYVPPSENLMHEVEKILEIQKDKMQHRTELLSRIAAYRLENPDKRIDLTHIFADFYDKIQSHFYTEKKKLIEENCLNMIALQKDTGHSLNKKQEEQAERTYANMEKDFSYSRYATFKCLQFALKNKDLFLR